MSVGPPKDGQLTLQRLDANPRWAGIPELEEAGPRAVTAYFRTYGPATFNHLCYWFGEGLSAGARRLESWFSELGDRLVAVDVDGAASYVLREDVDDLESSAPSSAVRFLPGHDQWVLGPGTKDVHVTPAPLRDLMTRKANPLVVGGVVCGTWARRGDQLTVRWLDERRRPDEEIAQEAWRLSELLGRELHLSLTSQSA